MTISLFDRVENTVGKGENAGYHHFLLFPQCFPKSSSSGVVKSQDCMVKSQNKMAFRNIVEKGENDSHQHLIVFL